MERNRENVTGGTLDLHLWTISRVTLAFIVQTFEIRLRMERGSINSYPGATRIKLKPSRKTETCVHPHKGLRKGSRLYSIEMTCQKIKGIYSDLPRSVWQQCWNNFHSCDLHPSPTWTACLMSLPCSHQDISTSSAFLGRLPVSHLHPRGFCSWICSSGSFVSAAMLLTLQRLGFPQPPQCYGGGRPSHDCRNKGKGSPRAGWWVKSRGSGFVASMDSSWLLWNTI